MAKSASPEVRAEAVRRVVQDGQSAAEAARIVGVSATAVRRWVLQDHDYGECESSSQTPRTPDRRRVRELEAEVHMLRQLVRYLARS